MPRRRDDELIELIDSATDDDTHGRPGLTATPIRSSPSHWRPIVAALVAAGAVIGAGVWLESIESSSPPSPNSTTTSNPPTTPAQVPGQPPRYVGDAPAGMFLAGSQATETPGDGWSYSVWATDGATATSGRWVAAQVWPGTLADVSLTDGWRHPAGISEVLTAFDAEAQLWTAWADEDSSDLAVVQTIAHGWNERDLLSLIESLGVAGGELTLGTTEATADLRLRQTGTSLHHDLLGGDGIVDTLVNPDEGSVMSVTVTATDAQHDQRFAVLAELLLRPTAKILTGTGDVAVTYDTGNWLGRTLARFADGEWTVTVAGTIPDASLDQFVLSIAESTTASAGYNRVSSRYPPDPLATAWLPTAPGATAAWRVVRVGDQLNWGLRPEGDGSVYQQRMAARGETSDTATLHSLSGSGFTAVWATAPDDGRSLRMRVVEGDGTVTEVPLGPIDSLFAVPVVAVHVFTEAHAFSAELVTDDGAVVAVWPTRGSAEK